MTTNLAFHQRSSNETFLLFPNAPCVGHCVSYSPQHENFAAHRPNQNQLRARHKRRRLRCDRRHRFVRRPNVRLQSVLAVAVRMHLMWFAQVLHQCNFDDIRPGHTLLILAVLLCVMSTQTIYIEWVSEQVTEINEMQIITMY